MKLVFSVLLAAMAVALAKGAPPPSPPNIVFLFSDDQSVPDLGCYGNRALKTPTLDQLAREGIVFTRAYVTSPQCSPSRASVFTGRTAHAVGASRLHANVPADVPNIIGWLKERGYHTGAYFRVHQDRIQKQLDFYERDQTVADYTPFFEQRPKDRPFFLQFAPSLPRQGITSGLSSGTHDPATVTVPDYLPDTPAVRRHLANHYDAIARFDTQCREILELLERYRLTGNTMVVMAADNGLGWPRAKATLFEPGIHVPLIVKWPGKIKPGQVSHELVTLMDLTATWLEAAGLPVPKSLESRSLLPLLTGGRFTPHRYVFAERNWHDHWDPMRCIVGQRYKLIQNYRPEVAYQGALDRYYSPSWFEIQRLADEGKLTGKLAWYLAPTRPQVELYDLEKDPGEWKNLASDPAFASLVTEYQDALSDWMNATNDFLPPPRKAFGAGSNYNQTVVDTLNGIQRAAPKR